MELHGSNICYHGLGTKKINIFFTPIVSQTEKKVKINGLPFQFTAGNITYIKTVKHIKFEIKTLTDP